MSDRFDFLEIGDTRPRPLPEPPPNMPPTGGSGWKPLRLRVVEVIGDPGVRAGEFSSPTGLATDRDGALYVADSNNHRIQRIAMNGDVHVYGQQPGTAAGELWGPVDVAVEPSGQFLFVAEQGNNRIQCFRVMNGQHRGTIGGFRSPSGVAFDSQGMLWIADSGNSRILRLNVQTGQFVGGFDQSTGIKRPVSVACDGGLNLYVTDGATNSVGRFTFAGAKTGALGENRRLAAPQQIAADMQGRIYVAEREANRLHVFDAEGNSLLTVETPGNKLGPLNAPCGVALGPNGEVYVADTLNHRILRLAWE